MVPEEQEQVAAICLLQFKPGEQPNGKFPETNNGTSLLWVVLFVFSCINLLPEDAQAPSVLVQDQYFPAKNNQIMAFSSILFPEYGHTL